MTRVILTLCLLFFNTNASANYFNSESFTLKNGMEVVVITNTKVPAVSHMVWYKIGAQDEPRGKSGIAHFLEHLMFKGTEKFGPGQFSKLVAKAGGNDNAFTSADFTAYFQNIARDKLELVMDMESDRMENLIFDKEEVLKERDVILEERSSRTDNNPSALLREQIKAALYQNHPYGIPIIGWRHEIAGLTLEDAQLWHDNYYTPNNAILVVSGDITAGELKPLVEKYYGTIEPRITPNRLALQEPQHNSARRITLFDKKVTKPEWYRNYIAPSQNTKGEEHCYALILLSHILAQSDTSRLYQRLVVEQEVASSVSSYYEDLMVGPSVFVFSAIPASGHNLVDIEKAIENEIEKVRNNPVTAEELSRAKNALIAQTIYAKEDLKTLAYFYGQAMSAGVGVQYVENWVENIQKVTVTDIQNAAKFVFKSEKSVTGELKVEE